MQKLTKSENIFGGWLFREKNLTNVQIIREIEILRTCDNLDAYKRVSRKGQTFKLNRQDRISVWMLFENAQNHASIALEMKAAGAI
tara:strand:- start:4652 stop:4909 length:258 start_codon:yes stop_codon:yes gene_type:complete